MSTIATLLSPWIGFVGGLIAWFVVTQKRSGNITVETTGDVTNAVAGNVTSWALGALTAFVLSLVFPGKFNSAGPEAMARNNKINGTANLQGQAPTVEKYSGSEREIDSEKREYREPASNAAPDTIVPTGNDMVDFLESKYVQPLDPVAYRRANKLAVWFNYIFFFVAIILVPFTLFGTEWIFTEAGFTGWVVVSFLWVWCSMCICVIWPVVESWPTISRIFRGVVKDAVTGGSGKASDKEEANITA